MKKLLLIFVILVSFAYAQPTLIRDFPILPSSPRYRMYYYDEMVDTKLGHHIVFSNHSLYFLNHSGELMWSINFGLIPDDHSSRIVDSKDDNYFLFVAGDSLLEIGYTGEIIKAKAIPVTMTPSSLSIYPGCAENETYYIVQPGSLSENSYVFVYNKTLELTRTFLVPGLIKNIMPWENFVYILAELGAENNYTLTKYDLNENMIWQYSIDEPNIKTSICSSGNILLYLYPSVIKVYGPDAHLISEINLPYDIYNSSTGQHIERPRISEIRPLSSGKFVALGLIHCKPWAPPGFEGVAFAYSETGDSLWTIRTPVCRFSSASVHSDSLMLFGETNYSNYSQDRHLWIYSFGVTGFNNNEQAPQTFFLSQNYPNPFNPTTRIDYYIPNAGMVVLKVYDSLGNEIATLVNEKKEAGNYSVNFDASKLASGVYIYRLIAGNKISAKKMILLK